MADDVRVLAHQGRRLAMRLDDIARLQLAELALSTLARLEAIELAVQARAAAGAPSHEGRRVSVVLLIDDGPRGDG